MLSYADTVCSSEAIGATKVLLVHDENNDAGDEEEERVSVGESKT